MPHSTSNGTAWRRQAGMAGAGLTDAGTSAAAGGRLSFSLSRFGLDRRATIHHDTRYRRGSETAAVIGQRYRAARVSKRGIPEKVQAPGGEPRAPGKLP